MNGILWKRIPGKEHYYASNDGQIKVSNHGKSRVLSPTENDKGYLVINLGRSFRKYVHELVLAAFVGPRPDGYQANHKDTNRQNNKIENLEWLPGAEHRAFHCGRGYTKRKNKYVVRVKLHGKYINIGRFERESDAIIARDAVHSIRVALADVVHE